MLAHARAPPLAATGRPVPVPVPARARARAWAWVGVPYPAWFFLNRASRVWVVSKPAPLPEPDPLHFESKPLLLDSQQSRLLGRTVATVQTEPLQPFVGFGPFGPSWSAINSALVSHSRHTNTNNSEKYLSLSQSSEASSELAVEF